MGGPRQSMMAEDEDLPRTVRRQKEAQEREAMERNRGLGQGPTGRPGQALERGGEPAYRAHETEDYDYGPEDIEPEQQVTVTHLQIPFFRLMLFFIKAVFAAIPALIILGALLWLAGDILMAYFPQLIKMQILIKVPH